MVLWFLFFADDGEEGKDAEGSKQVKASKGNEEEITSPKYDHKEANQDDFQKIAG